MKRYRRSDVGSRRLAYSLALICGIGLHAAVDAQSIDLAHEAYTEGQFLEAAQIGEHLGTANGLVLAAKSLSIHAHYLAENEEKGPLLIRAIGLAEAAIDLDPGNADAHLQHAQAIGRHAQTVGSFEAASRGYAEKVRASTDQAIAINPELASAYLSRGRWRAGLVDALGTWMAKFLYGARPKQAIADFEQALVLAPHTKEVPWQYALGILTLDPNRYQEKARSLLQRAVAIPARDAYERILDREARELLQRLDTPSE